MREGESVADGENSINIFVSPYVKLIAGEKLLYNTGNPACCSVMISRGGVGGSVGRGYMYNYG